MASRLSQILINQRVILESFDAEKRIEQLEAPQLPEIVEPSPAIERGSPSFNRPLTTPPLEIV